MNQWVGCCNELTRREPQECKIHLYLVPLLLYISPPHLFSPSYALTTCFPLVLLFVCSSLSVCPRWIISAPSPGNDHIQACVVQDSSVCDSLRWEVATPGASQLLDERWCVTSCLPVSQHNPACKLLLSVFHTNSFVLRNMPQPLLILIRPLHFPPDDFFFVNAGHTPSCFVFCFFSLK